MASFKQVTLKDPTTGDYLSPRVYGAIEYEVVEDGEVTPPYDMNADTLQGHPASDFLLKSEYTPVDLSEYLKTATADTKYAAVDHNHNGVYAPVSHTHSISQITGLQSELNSLKTSVSNGKSAVASAITDKGVSTSATASFDTMAANIKKISSGIEITSGVLPYNTFARIADGSVSAPGDYGYNEMTLPFNATSGNYLLMFELNVDSSKATPLFYCGGESEFDIPCARFLNISVRISGTTVTAEGVDKGNDRSHRITGKIWYKKF